MPRAPWSLLLPLLLAGAAAPAAPPSLAFDRQVGHLHHYKGTARLEGIVERRTDPQTLEIVGDNLCFAVAEASRRHIPRDGDPRAAWFCFSDRAAALRALRLPMAVPAGSCGYRMPATVVVGRYVANRQESDVHDTAALLSVERRGAVAPIRCEPS